MDLSLLGQSRKAVGRHRAALTGLGPWVGARVASPRSPILRLSSLNVTQGIVTEQTPPPWTWPDAGRRPAPVSPAARPRSLRRWRTSASCSACWRDWPRDCAGCLARTNADVAQAREGKGGGRRAGWPQGIAPLGLPQIRTCTFAHTAPHIMSSLRDGSLSESALRLVPDSATVVGSWTRLWVSMHPTCFPPTVS